MFFFYPECNTTTNTCKKASDRETEALSKPMDVPVYISHFAFFDSFTRSILKHPFDDYHSIFFHSLPSSLARHLHFMSVTCSHSKCWPLFCHAKNIFHLTQSTKLNIDSLSLYAYQCFILIHSKYFTSTQMDK